MSSITGFVSLKERWFERVNIAHKSRQALNCFLSNLCIRPSNIIEEPTITVEFSRGNKAAVIIVTPEEYIISLATDKETKSHRAFSGQCAANLVERFLLTNRCLTGAL